MLTTEDILDAFEDPAKFAKLADIDDYSRAGLDLERASLFAKTGLPDPAVVRSWWDGSADLPTGQENYSKWLNLGVLRFSGVTVREPFFPDLPIYKQLVSLSKELMENLHPVVEKSEPATEE